MQRRRGLRLDDGQPGVGHLPHGGGGLLEAGGEVAGVEADPDRLGVDHPAEAGHRVVGGVDDAAGLGLQPDPDRAAGLGADLAERLGELAEPSPGGGVAVGEPRRAPAEGDGGDAAGGRVVGQQPREHRRAVDRVVEPGRLGPVGVVDRALDDLVVEAGVREGVEGHDLEPEGVELAPEAGEGGGVPGEHPRGLRREPEAHPEQVGPEGGADAGGVRAQLVEQPVDRLGGVHVAAVGQVDGAAVRVAEPHRRSPRSSELPSKVAVASVLWGSATSSSSRPLWP